VLAIETRRNQSGDDWIAITRKFRPNSAIPVITAALYAHASAKVIVYHENGRE
jgi:hypothetical protein